MGKQEFEQLIKKADRRYRTMLNEAYSSYLSGATEVGDALLKYVNSKNIVSKHRNVAWDDKTRYFILVNPAPVKNIRKNKRK